ncbi:hypothetical protein P171DRAFT_472077 [Karstenula rhodostoma CBS 690.94]|uniref:Rhodopsin domain-containing protein n=1 Tax=Karstenula rhodostoma CBS 690.94 TaxID=1392251 RepID=A0A9P4PK77_9PLEO|nr:hypothetical protein P171DRAFT_472077 [Karstenula rhodostoma CBS 690.94]
MDGVNRKAQRHQFNLSIACAVISTLSIGIRIYCKIRHKQGVHSDDYWIIVGLTFYCACVATIPMVTWRSIGGQGLNEPLDIIANDLSSAYLLEDYLKSEFVGFTFLICATYAIKMSILLFYRRILLVTQCYRRISLGLMILSTSWFISTEVANLLSCQPMDAFWHRTKPGKCLNFNALFIGTALVEAVIDLIILLLPLRVILTLHLPMRTRVAVAGIFALGGLAVVTNIIRIHYVYQLNGKKVSPDGAQMWVNIHVLTAIVCACCPVYKPLWVSISQGVKDALSRYARYILTMLGRSNNTSENTSHVRMGNMGNRGDAEASTDQILSQDTLATERNSMGRIEVRIVGGREVDAKSLHIPSGDIEDSRTVDV